MDSPTSPLQLLYLFVGVFPPQEQPSCVAPRPPSLFRCSYTNIYSYTLYMASATYVLQDPKLEARLCSIILDLSPPCGGCLLH